MLWKECIWIRIKVDAIILLVEYGMIWRKHFLQTTKTQFQLQFLQYIGPNWLNIFIFILIIKLIPKFNIYPNPTFVITYTMWWKCLYFVYRFALISLICVKFANFMLFKLSCNLWDCGHLQCSRCPSILLVGELNWLLKFINIFQHWIWLSLILDEVQYDRVGGCPLIVFNMSYVWRQQMDALPT
jgi:hypothetical protein